MMDNLRAAANHVVLKIILGLIIVSFILTGVGNYLIGNNNNYAAEVNGQEIGRAQFEQAFANERNRLQQQAGEQFSQLAANEAWIASLRQQVLNRLIDEALLDQYVKKLGLSISDEQVKQAIFATPAFQNEGKFDNSRYNAIINQAGMTADQYAQALRTQLTAQQFINAITDTDFMLQGETDELVTLISQQRVAREATIDINALADKQQATDQDITRYYQQNKNSFVTPEQFRVSYIKMDAADLKETASEAEIQDYYHQHLKQFTQPRRERYHIIQTKTEDEAKAILDQLHKGADFATLAKEKSIDIISARQGGDMGWLESATTPEELKNTGLKEKGQLSDVIKSSIGFLIVRLDDIQPEKIKPLAQARDDIAAKVKQEKALDAYYALQQKVSDAASNDNESLAGAEQTAGVKAVETDWFDRNNLPKDLDFKPVADILFNGSLIGQNGAPGSNSDIITVDGDRAFVLRVSAHKPAEVKSLATVKNQVIERVKHNKAVQQAKRDADKLLTELKAGKGSEALKAMTSGFSAEKTFSRIDQSPVSQAVFTLPLPTKNKPSYGMVSDMQGNVILLALEEIKTGTMSPAHKEEMVQGITQNNAQLVFEALMSNLRASAKIRTGDIIERQ